MIRTRTTRATPGNDDIESDDLQVLRHGEQHGRIRIVYTNPAGVTRTRTITFR